MAERVQQVKGPGARPPRGVKPQVKNPMKIFTRIMKYALKDYTVHCIAVVIAIFVNVLANVQGTMFMKTLIDGYITPMLTGGSVGCYLRRDPVCKGKAHRRAHLRYGRKTAE